MSHCGSCGAAFLATPADRCPACGSAALAPRTVSGEGVVAAATTVRLAPPGVDVPYTLAYADFPSSIRLLARVDAAVSAGDVVRLEPVDDELEGFRFRFLAGAA